MERNDLTLDLNGPPTETPSMHVAEDGKVRKSYRPAVTLLFIRFRGRPLTTMTVRSGSGCVESRANRMDPGSTDGILAGIILSVGEVDLTAEI